MTEKRFKRFTFADGFKIVAICDNGKIMNSTRVCDKLNELAEENKLLLRKNGAMEEEIECLSEENEQLKQQLELYQELYPSGKWICDLNSDELKKELSENEL